MFSEVAALRNVQRDMWNKGENLRQMDLVVHEIEEGNMTVRKVAVSYGISKSTLHNNVKGKVQLGAAICAQKYLMDEEEEEVVRWLEGCAKVGCAKSISEVKAVVEAIVAKKLGVDCITVSHGWWDRFQQ